MPVRSVLLTSFLVLLGSIPSFSQTAVTKDPTAVSLINAATATLADSTPISQIELTATATQTIGPDTATGTATLTALGGTASRLALSLSNGSQGEVLNQATSGPPQGAYSGTDGVWHAHGLANCWVPASWFFPTLALAEAVNDPAVGMANLGPTTWNNEAVQHVQFWRVVPAQNSTPAALALIQQLSTADVYLDAATHLPVGMDFNTHPDSNANVNFATEIRYSNYQSVGGVSTPTHIQKYVNNTLLLDLFVTNATANANLSLSDFTVAVQ